MPDLGEVSERGGSAYLYEIEMGKMSELEVKWHCFARRAALEKRLSPKSGCPRTLGHTSQPMAYGSCQLWEISLKWGNLIFLVVRGMLGESV